MTSDQYLVYDPFAWLYSNYCGGEFVQMVLPLLEQPSHVRFTQEKLDRIENLKLWQPEL